MLPGTNSLLTLEKLIKDVFLPLADPDQVADALEHERVERKAAAAAAAIVAQQKDEKDGSLSHSTSTVSIGAGKESGVASAASSSAAASHKVVGPDDGSDAVRNEFSVNMQKFASQLQHAIQQVSGKVQLPMPPVEILDAKTEALLRSITDESEHSRLKQLALERASSNESIITPLEAALEDWVTIMANVMDQESRKKPIGEGPMAEITFWRDRNAALSALYEQLNMERVKDMIKVMELAVNVNAMDLFKKHLQDLLKLYTEAKDNVKFLTTLERHFKNLASGNLTTIFETIPSMMNSLRMVWIISRHYNKDPRMFPLMERIAKEIANKVAKDINIMTLMKPFHCLVEGSSSTAANGAGGAAGANANSKDKTVGDNAATPEDVIRTIQKGKDVLDIWYTAYMSVRTKIEESGTDRRWEFNRNKLFDHTQYMSKICENLLDVAETLDQFRKFLGPELKAVTGDPQGIDEVLTRVQSLITPLEYLPYNIFDARYNGSWDQHMKEFHEKVEEIENRTKVFIDSSFRKLRSAEGAFDLLQNFKNIESRESIQRQMMLKFTDILIQYSREVARVKAIFEAGRASPPVSKNQPPIAGAIAWTRSLYYRLKKSILRFQTMPKLLESEEGKTVCRDYVTVARAITQYEAVLMKDWCQKVNEVVTKRLKEPIFRYYDGGDMASTQQPQAGNAPMPSVPESSEHNNDGMGSQQQIRGGGANQSTLVKGGAEFGSSMTASRAVHDSRTGRPGAPGTSSSSGYGLSSSHGAGQGSSSGGGDNGNGRGLDSSSGGGNGGGGSGASRAFRKILINFSPELKEIIRETRYLDRMGLDIPELARNVALQEKKYYELVEKLSAMLGAYTDVIGKLNSVEKVLLDARLRSLHRVLRPGFEQLNWNALGIILFIDSCDRAIASFETVVSSVHKQAEAVGRSVGFIRSARLVNSSSFVERSEVLNVEDLNDLLEKHRLQVVEDLVREYKKVGPVLAILESYVVSDEGTNGTPSTNTNNVVRLKESGSADELYEYYRYWEYKIFTSLTSMIAVGMRDFQTILLGAPPKKCLGSETTPLPLIRVTAEMTSAPAISVTPNIQDIYKTLSKLLRNIPESAKTFVRWMDGQCRECEPVPISDDETFTYTFYDDLSKNPVVVPLMLSVTQSMQKVIHSVDKYIDSWHLYNTKYNLWNQKEIAGLERLRQKQQPTAYFDKHLSKYTRLIDEVSLLPTFKDIDFIRIDCTPLIDAIKRQASEWVRKYGDILSDMSTSQLHKVMDEINSFARHLAKPTDGIDELKFVLNVIAEIKSNNLRMELSFREITEKFECMRLYGIRTFAPKDGELVDNLGQIWSQLMEEARARDVGLLNVKDKFKAITAAQIKEYQVSVKQLRERFEASGPGSADMDLDDGLDSMKAYRVELRDMIKTRDTLVLSEKLFNIPPTSFSDLYFVEEEMEKLNQLYTLYAAMKESMKKCTQHTTTYRCNAIAASSRCMCACLIIFSFC